MDWLLATEGDRLFQCGIVRGGGGGGGGRNYSGHYCMSGVCCIEHYVMTWLFSNCEQGSYNCLFQ